MVVLQSLADVLVMFVATTCPTTTTTAATTTTTTTPTTPPPTTTPTTTTTTTTTKLVDLAQGSSRSQAVTWPWATSFCDLKYRCTLYIPTTLAHNIANAI